MNADQTAPKSDLVYNSCNLQYRLPKNISRRGQQMIKKKYACEHIALVLIL